MLVGAVVDVAPELEAATGERRLHKLDKALQDRHVRVGDKDGLAGVARRRRVVAVEGRSHVESAE